MILPELFAQLNGLDMLDRDKIGLGRLEPNFSAIQQKLKAKFPNQLKAHNQFIFLQFNKTIKQQPKPKAKYPIQL